MAQRHDLLLVPDVPDESEILEGVEGLAWEHATLYGTLADIEIGSDEFVELHKGLLENYRESGRHLGFIQHTAMRLIQGILETGKVALVVRKDDSDESVTENLTYLAHIATSCIMWMHASYPVQWIDNITWEHLDEDFRGVEFTLTIPTEGERNDDDR